MHISAPAIRSNSGIAARVVSRSRSTGSGADGRPSPRADSTGQKVTGAITWTLVPRVLQAVVSLVTSILIVRTLGEFDYGTLSVLRSLLIFAVVVLGLGLDRRSTVSSGASRHRSAPEGRGLLYRCLLLQSSLWAVTCLGLFLARSLLRPITRPTPTSSCWASSSLWPRWLRVR